MATTTKQAKDALIARWIEPNPNKPGRDEYRLKEHSQSVWAIIAYWQGAQGNVDRVARDFGIPREAVQAALAYYRLHREIIDNRLAANSGDEAWEQEKAALKTMPEGALIARWIEPNPNKPGHDEYRLQRHYQSVWAIIAYWLGMGKDPDAVARAFAIPREAVEAAVAYYGRHRAVINNRIAANTLEDPA